MKSRWEFRTTHEVTSGTAMRHRRYRNAFGPLRPGHIIEFNAVPQEAGESHSRHRLNSCTPACRNGRACVLRIEGPGRLVDVG